MLKVSNDFGLKKLEFELPLATCRNKCIFCSNYGGQSTNEILTKEEVFRIVKDFSDVGGEILVLSGGEPLECPYLYELIEYAKKKNLEVYIYSSGYMLNEENIEKLLSLNIERLYVTIHGTEATHDKVANLEGSYKASISGVENAAKNGIYVGINFIPMKVNWKEWKKVLERAIQLGVKEFRFIEFMPQGRGWENRSILELTPEEYFEMLQELSRDLPKLVQLTDMEISTGGINFGFLIDDSLFSLPTCSAGTSGLTITPEGYIIPCLGCRTKPGSKKPDDKYILAKYRLKPYNFLNHLWLTSPILKKFSELTPSKLDGDCKYCRELMRCKGGCPIRREIQTGDILKGPDFRCIINLI